jgi:hypothetical protein
VMWAERRLIFGLLLVIEVAPGANA